jgi:MFS family permease
MRISTVEGVSATIHGNLTGGVIFTSFLLTLGAKDYQFAILNAVSAISQIPQVLSAFWMGRMKSRKAVVISTALASRLILCFIVLLPYMFPFPIALKVVIGAALLWGALISIAGNAWTAWMSDLVPRRIRGRYFSSRNFAIMLASVITSLTACWFLDQFSEAAPKGLFSFLPSPRGTWIFVPSHKMAAFTFLYLLAVIPAVACAILLYSQYEPERPKVARVTLQGFVPSLKEPFSDGMFVKFLAFTCIYNFINSFAGPYWTPFCLEYLHMSYLTLAACGVMGTVGGLLTARLWGRLSDRHGNRPVIILTMTVTAFHPLLYLIATKTFVFPVYVDFISSGVMWIGYSIAMSNLLLLFGTARTKDMFFAVYATCSALVIFIGSLISGTIITHIPTVYIGHWSLNRIQIIFFFTSMFRYMSLLAAARLIIESGSKTPGVVVEGLFGKWYGTRP